MDDSLSRSFTGQRRRRQNSRVLANPDTFATTLLVLLLDEYGMEAVGWAPETWFAEIESDFGVQLPDVSRGKLVSAVNILTTDDFFRRVGSFVRTCNSLAGGELTEEFDRADAMECAWGVTEALLLSPPDTDEPFSREILAYIGAVLDEEGIREPPDVLRIALRDSPGGQPDYSGMSLQDPDMFAGEFQHSQETSRYISERLESLLRDLFAELQELELANGKTENLLSRMSTR